MQKPRCEIKTTKQISIDDFYLLAYFLENKTNKLEYNYKDFFKFSKITLVHRNLRGLNDLYTLVFVCSNNKNDYFTNKIIGKLKEMKYKIKSIKLV